MSIPKHERAPSRLDAQHMARKISMEITTELARTFGYSKAKFEKRIETMTKYLPPGPDREQAAAQIREQEQAFQRPVRKGHHMEKEKRTWTVTLADGTKLENLTLNNGANTFHSPAEITMDTFDGKLSEVHIAASDGDMTECAYPDTLHDAELVQIMQPIDTPDSQWAFILREIPEEERYRKEMEQKNEMLTQCLMEMSEIVYA